MSATNFIVILSDEHNKRVTGCYGHPQIKTPNLDRLAARGTRFTSAYTNCPICVPARAAFALGRYVHDVGYWDNSDAYEGSLPSWHHILRAAGHRTVSIGKLRGKFFDYKGIKVLCTYHPSYLLRNPAAKKDVWEDMQFFRRDMGVDLTVKGN